MAFDDHPDNAPHVGCVFQVDFYGFDEGDLFADVTFEVHPPTGEPAVILEDEVFMGEDDNSGGGSEAGLDASRTYDLSTLQGFEQHPQQGWHVKLTHQRRRGAERGREAQGVLGLRLRDAADDDLDVHDDDLDHDDFDVHDDAIVHDDLHIHDDAIVHHELDTDDEHVHAVGPRPRARRWAAATAAHPPGPGLS